MKTDIITREEQTDFGKIWYVNSSDNAFRFAVYRYDDDLDTVYLSNVFVSEKRRGNGLGNVILNSAESIAKNMGAKTICLKAKKNSVVYDWYARHGYTDIEPDIEDADYEWMQKNIK